MDDIYHLISPLFWDLPKHWFTVDNYGKKKRFPQKTKLNNRSGQISIIPKPELRGFWGSSLIKPPFRVTSADVVIICPDRLFTPLSFPKVGLHYSLSAVECVGKKAFSIHFLGYIVD